GSSRAVVRAHRRRGPLRVLPRGGRRCGVRRGARRHRGAAGGRRPRGGARGGDVAGGGGERWRVTLEKRLSAGVGANERSVVVATEDGDVFALSAGDGKQRRRPRGSSEGANPPP